LVNLSFRVSRRSPLLKGISPKISAFLKLK
jgi:hypothetical protein